MGRDYKLVVRDDFLPSAEADFMSELARSHRYEDTKSDFAYFGAGVSDGYRIYKQIKQYTSRADGACPEFCVRGIKMKRRRKYAKQDEDGGERQK